MKKTSRTYANKYAAKKKLFTPELLETLCQFIDSKNLEEELADFLEKRIPSK